MKHTKLALVVEGATLLGKFCDLNRLPEPRLDIIYDAADRECALIKRVGTCGYYRNGVVTVAVPLCAHQNPNYSWAAFISDRTPFGVLQHELGHHADQIKTGYDIYDRAQPDEVFYSTSVRSRSGEAPITSYCPNTTEWFAEVFRLFITNPALLCKIRPRAYSALVSDGWRPATNMDERQVLAQFDAPPRVYERMQKWLSASAKLPLDWKPAKKGGKK